MAKMYKVPDWFNEKAYLKAHPDVAKSRILKHDPFRHFVQSGYKEKRTWLGDPRPPHKPCKLTHYKPEDPYKPPSEPTGPGSLKIGDYHKVSVDGFSGEEDHTEADPSEDNPEYDRHNIKRAVKKRFAYWYSSRRYGKGYVDYKPDFAKLGTGEYEIKTPIRLTRNRPSEYDAVYEIFNGDSDLIYDKRVNQHSEKSKYGEVDLGTHHMDVGSYVRISDTVGRKSIMMGPMYFVRRS